MQQAVTLCVNVKRRIWLDTRLDFYVNTGVTMYTDPTQTGSLKQALGGGGGGGELRHFPGHTVSEVYPPLL